MIRRPPRSTLFPYTRSSDLLELRIQELMPVFDRPFHQIGPDAKRVRVVDGRNGGGPPGRSPGKAVPVRAIDVPPPVGKRALPRELSAGGGLPLREDRGGLCPPIVPF